MKDTYHLGSALRKETSRRRTQWLLGSPLLLQKSKNKTKPTKHQWFFSCSKKCLIIMQLLKSIVCRPTGKHTHNHKRLQREVREDPVLPQSLPSGDSPARGQGSGYKHWGIRVSAGKREEAKGQKSPHPSSTAWRQNHTPVLHSASSAPWKRTTSLRER